MKLLNGCVKIQKADFGIKNIRAMSELRKTHPYPDYHPVLANSCPDLMEFLVELASLKYIKMKLFMFVKTIIYTFQMRLIV